MGIFSTGLTLLASTLCNWHFHYFYNQTNILLTTLVTTSLTGIPDDGTSHNPLQRGHNSSSSSPHFSTRMTHSAYFCYTSQVRILNSQPRMDVAVEILNLHIQAIRDWKDNILFYIERTELTIVSLLVRYIICILLTPVLYFLTTVIIEVYSQCFTESVSLRDIGKPTSRAEISSPSSSYLKAVKGAHIGSALIAIGALPPF